jgi:predicted ribosome quality control (RQC) complex YloA/Tae2 family protein
MATVQGMSGLDVRAGVLELAERLPLWIGKWYQFDAKTVGVRINGEGHIRYHFLIEAGRRAHLIDQMPTPPKSPPGFAMLLRKFLTGGRVTGIRQKGLERVFSIDVMRKDASYHLIVELFDEGNIVLTDEAYTIIKPLWHHRFKDRQVVPGEPYDFAAADCTAMPLQEFERVLVASEKDLVRTIAVDCMFGGLYAEDAVRRSGLDKTMPAAQSDAQRVHVAVQALLHDVETRREPVIAENGCWPVPLLDARVLRTFPTFNQALGSFYPTIPEPGDEAPQAKSTLTRDEVIRRQQQESVKKFDTRIVRLERTVDAAYEHYQQIDEAIRTLSAASATRSWQEIERVIRESERPVARMVAAFHPDEAAVELEIEKGVRMKVYVRESVERNIARLYDQIKKVRKKKEGALKALGRPLPTKKPQQRDRPEGKPRWFMRYRWFVTSDGTLVIGGKDAGQNEEIVKKYLAGGDTFVHADVHGASVIVVKGKTEQIDEVVRFAAAYSGAWRSGYGSVDVFTASPDQVSKTPPAGEYVTSGSFIIRGERVWYRHVPLETAIGLAETPHPTVIGGPRNAVDVRASIVVHLRPGQFEANDISKKVVRMLRERIPPESQAAWQGALTTEKVAAFIPPGGSDIVEDA